ncbi:MAG: ECF transporter S component [Ruminococcaceae bacterium]|nr:ECF transporter S component [Oscillospiraceae bacterium]
MSKKTTAVNTTLRLVMSALFLSISIVLPMVISMGSSQLGQTFLPMHLPVMLCGIVCGTPYGIVVGLIAPLLKSVITGLPVITSAISMAFELATYGGMCGMLYKAFPKKIGFIYPNLLISMIVGRIVNGAVQYLILTASDNDFALKSFITLTTVNALPGIVIQLALIPLIVLALRKTRFMLNG